MHDQIGKLVDRSDTRIAYERSDPDFYYGFICGDTSDARYPIVHYVYVKGPYRKSGYARGLFAALGVDPDGRFEYTCRTGIVRVLLHKVPRADWNPLAARFPKEARQERSAWPTRQQRP